MLHGIISFFAGYIVGMINPTYIISKIKGINIRKEGSGNTGGANALITMGKLIGIFCMIFDIMKAFIIIKVMLHIYPATKIVFSCTAAGVILGHIFPAYAKLKGGKGLACLGGTVLAFNPVVLLIFLGAELIVAFSTGYICFVPITASVAFPVVYGVMTSDIPGTVILSVPMVVIVLKHVENLKRIKNGTELKLSYLWKKDKELQRIGATSDNEESKKQ